MGNLQQGRIASHTPLRQLADFAPTTHVNIPHHARDVFLCIYMYIYTYLHLYLRTFKKTHV